MKAFCFDRNPFILFKLSLSTFKLSQLPGGGAFRSFLLTSSSLLTNSVKAMLVVVTTGEDTFAAGEAEAFGAGKAASAYQAAIVRRKQLMYAG